MEKPQTGPDKERITSNPLSSYLGQMEKFVSEVSASAVQGLPRDSEHYVLLTATSESLLSQLKKVTAYAIDSASKLSDSQQLELAVLMQIQDGESIANRGITVAQGATKRGFGAGLVKWLNKFFIELKKILRMILEFILGLFGLELPKWYDKLELLLDEIFRLLLALLGESKGLDDKSLSLAMHEEELYYLREITFVESLTAARTKKSAQQED